jgi:hypothetical protein
LSHRPENRDHPAADRAAVKMPPPALLPLLLKQDRAALRHAEKLDELAGHVSQLDPTTPAE